MKVICPEHEGTIEVIGAPIVNTKNLTISDLVIECPVCDEEVIINGVYDYDEAGLPLRIDNP